MGNTSCFESLETRRLFAAGLPDPAFGNGGLVITDFNSTVPLILNGTGQEQQDNAVAVIPLAGGRILTVGEVFIQSPFDDPFSGLTLARYNADGSLDSTFGTGGKITTT